MPFIAVLNAPAWALPAAGAAARLRSSSPALVEVVLGVGFGQRRAKRACVVSVGRYLRIAALRNRPVTACVSQANDERFGGGVDGLQRQWRWLTLASRRGRLHHRLWVVRQWRLPEHFGAAGQVEVQLAEHHIRAAVSGGAQLAAGPFRQALRVGLIHIFWTFFSFPPLPRIKRKNYSFPTERQSTTRGLVFALV